MTSPSQIQRAPLVGESRARQSKVLLIAWEYPGAHSRQGTALARRVGQVARGLAGLGWSVTVVHRLQRDGDPGASSTVEEAGPDGRAIRRRAIEGPPAASRLARWLMPLRKLATVWTAFSSGDRSGRWATNVLRAIDRVGIERPDMIIAFFTPRGPLAIASSLEKRWGVPWIADFQDPWWEGTSQALRPLVARWMRRTLRSASSIVQVSPEWAREAEEVLKRRVEVVRHAVPGLAEAEVDFRTVRGRAAFRILYVGSLNPDQQDVRPFMDALALMRKERGDARPVELAVAAGEESWKLFSEAAGTRGISDATRWLGWLDARSLRREMLDADCLLLIPMAPAHRRGVPSKLFEYLAYPTPVLVAGPDSGGMTSLLEEWAHPPVVASTPLAIASAIRRAREGDGSALLHRRRCANAPVTDAALAKWYSDRMHDVLHQVHST